ncbi:DUF7093 family protein [Natrinema salsiterrestre]|uniref:Uncharacterized protein n=1 Tax=Natrinema salsiterrestre TaxID=2950540 RepID=A0A9Q4L2N3_9EURY|nr:hypothetical protein [Natrinema salsiterrestre]MDF9744830.1 hypothetical protein [Natrinema salsiterrestre]
MVLRCSLLGHDFGEAEVEREREERGSEVVVTVQEYEECARCGEKHVISENTEVTSLSAGTDADSIPDEPDTEPPEPPLESDAPDGDPDGDTEFIDADDAVAETPDGDDAELIDADDTESTGPETEPSAIPDPDSTTAAAPETEADGDAGGIDLPSDQAADPVTDDGEILEDDEDSPDRDRDHGEWPDSDDVGPPVGSESEPTTWPDDAADAEPDAGTGGPDPAEIDDDAVLLEDDETTSGTETGTPGGTEATTGAATDARSVTADPPRDAESDPATDADSGTGIERAASAPTPAESSGGPADDVPTEFYCPRCEYVAPGNRSSLRSGDICPDCRKGYLSERERRQ